MALVKTISKKTEFDGCLKLEKPRSQPTVVPTKNVGAAPCLIAEMVGYAGAGRHEFRLWHRH